MYGITPTGEAEGAVGSGSDNSDGSVDSVSVVGFVTWLGTSVERGNVGLALSSAATTAQ